MLLVASLLSWCSQYGGAGLDSVGVEAQWFLPSRLVPAQMGKHGCHGVLLRRWYLPSCCYFSCCRLRRRYPGGRQCIHQELQPLRRMMTVSKGGVAVETGPPLRLVGSSGAKGGGDGAVGGKKLAQGDDAGSHQVKKGKIDAIRVVVGNKERVAPKRGLQAPGARLQGMLRHILDSRQAGQPRVQALKWCWQLCRQPGTWPAGHTSRPRGWLPTSGAHARSKARATAAHGVLSGSTNRRVPHQA